MPQFRTAISLVTDYLVFAHRCNSVIRDRSARRAVAASHAKASNVPICAGWLMMDQASDAGAMRPAGSSATSAAGGNALLAGSQIARSTANGTPNAPATAATAPLSMSTAAAPVSHPSRRFSVAVTMTRSIPRHRWPVSPPSRTLSDASVGHDRPSPTTSFATIKVPGGNDGSRPPARPKLTTPVAPESISWRTARAAPSVEPPPIATGQPNRRAILASAAKPTTNAGDARVTLQSPRRNRAIARRGNDVDCAWSRLAELCHDVLSHARTISPGPANRYASRTNTPEDSA
jgi:hypothetical protein